MTGPCRALDVEAHKAQAHERAVERRWRPAGFRPGRAYT